MWKTDPAATLYILALAVLAYANSMSGPLQFDDYIGVGLDSAMRDWRSWSAAVVYAIRPLLKASFILSGGLGRWLAREPMGHHLGNLLIHLACIVLAATLARAFTRSCCNEAQSAVAPQAGWICAAVFALHPLGTEAVTYISGRSVSLSTLFAFISIAAYVKSRSELAGATQQRNSTALMLLSLLAYAAAIATRETQVVIPAVLLVWEWARRDAVGTPFTAKRLRESAAPLAVFAALLALGVLWLITNDGYRFFLGLSARIAAARVMAPSLLGALEYFTPRLLLVAPLNIDPDVHFESMRLLERLLLSLAAGSALLGAWRLRRQRPQLLIGLAWMGIWLAPTYLIQARHDALAERHFYPALWGAAFVVGVELALLLRGSLRAGASVRSGASYTGWLLRGTLVALFGVLMVCTVVRNRDYSSEIALWKAAAFAAPNKPRAHNNLGFAYLEAGRWIEAEAELQRALELDPGYEKARNNLDLAVLRRETGDPRATLGP